MYPLRNEPIGEGDERQNEQKESAGFIVKEPTDEEQIDVAKMQFFMAKTVRNDLHDQRKKSEDQRKKCPEIELSEQQRTVWVKS